MKQLRPSIRPVRPKPPRDWVWSDPAEYDGLVWPRLTRAQVGERLEPWLKQDLRLWDTQIGLVAVFDAPCALDPAALGGALPLRRAESGGITSYPDVAPRADELSVFYGGVAHRLDLTDANPIDPVTLWHIDATLVATAAPLPERPKPDKPPVGVAQNSVLKAGMTRKDPLGDIRAHVDAASSTTARDVARQGMDAAKTTATVMVRLVLLIMFLAFLVMMVSLLVSVVSGAAKGEANAGSVILGLVAVWIIWRMIAVMRGGSEERLIGETSSRPSAGRRTRGPGLGQRLKGWLFWNTGAGNKLRSALEKRLAETERLLRDGRVDDALKRALALGKNSGKKPGALSSRLPEIRSSLDLSFQSHSGGSFLMGEDGYTGMMDRYSDLAVELENKGDHKRAAFIFSELLSNQYQALQVLKRGKLYEEAAKFATAHDLGVDEIAVLWYLAGKRDIAIMMAKRHDQMGSLVSAAEGHNKNAAQFFRAVWADHLVALGDYRQALQVTDKVTQLSAQRMVWLAEAIGLGDNPGADSEIMHRAVVALPWDTRVFETGYRPDPTRVGGQVETYLRLCAQNPQKAQALLGYLAQALDYKHVGITAFLPLRGRCVVDRLLREVIASGAPVAQPVLKSWGALAGAAGLSVLAEDLKMVRRQHPKQPKPQEKTLPLAHKPHEDWCHAALAWDGRTLAVARSGRLVLMDAEGRAEWSDFVQDLVGLVRVDRGRYVLLLLRAEGQSLRIIRFDTVQRTHLEIGALALEHWAESTTEQFWLVMCKGRIQALDIGAMFNAQPQFEELWGVTVKEPVQVLNFETDGRRIDWYMQRRVEDGYGLIEHWWAYKNNLSFNVNLLEHDLNAAFAKKASPDINPMYTEAVGVTASSAFSLFHEGDSVTYVRTGPQAYHWDVEARISRDIKRAGGLNTKSFVVGFPHDVRGFTRTSGAGAAPEFRLRRGAGVLVEFQLVGLHPVSVQKIPQTDRVLVLGSDGRLILFDKQTLDVREL